MQDIFTVKWRDHYNWVVAEKRIREEALAAARKILMKQRFGAAQAMRKLESFKKNKAELKRPPAPPWTSHRRSKRRKKNLLMP